MEIYSQIPTYEEEGSVEHFSIFNRGSVIDFNLEEGEELYQLYFLTDPREGDICYIGITKQDFNNRLSQHRNPISENQSAIAKLQRMLKKEGLTLQGEVVATGSKEMIELCEQSEIKAVRVQCGQRYLKNLQDGGLSHYGAAEESKRKYWKTFEENRKKGKHKNTGGENSHTSKISKEKVLEIYSMINDLYSNLEIKEALNLEIGLTSIQAIRDGSNWNDLFKEQNMVFIPSMNIAKGALNSRQKVAVLKLIERGVENKDIQKDYKVQTTDLNRIRRKDLWKLAWNVYENYYNKLNNE